MRKQSQESMIKNHLLLGKPIDPLTALKNYGCMRLAAIIHILSTKHGLEIESKLASKNGKHWAVYSYKGPKTLHAKKEVERDYRFGELTHVGCGGALKEIIPSAFKDKRQYRCLSCDDYVLKEIEQKNVQYIEDECPPAHILHPM